MRETWSKRDFVRLLLDNGYSLLRSGHGSHQIYANAEGDKITVAREINRMVALRMIKEHKLVKNKG